MGIVKIQTNFNIDLEFESAEFHRRLIAWVIDLVIQVAYVILVFKLFSFLRDGRGLDPDDSTDSWAIGLVLILPFFLYHLVCEILLNGQSPGKRVMGIRVVNENGGRASISQYLIRWLIRTSDYSALLVLFYLPYAAASYGLRAVFAILGSFLLLLLDIILVASTRKAQRLGDMLAGTILIRTNPRGDIRETVFQEVSGYYIPTFPQIMQLSDKDINAIKSILDSSRKKSDYQLAAMASDKIKRHLHIESALSPFDFLDLLLKDYNYLSTQ
ncbi:MAG TPA: RDD family protein [Chitinophagaceae bacterium]|nr:RDD family protein [Chitinophagaceae bacterium]